MRRVAWVPVALLLRARCGRRRSASCVDVQQVDADRPATMHRRRSCGPRRAGRQPHVVLGRSSRSCGRCLRRGRSRTCREPRRWRSLVLAAIADVGAAERRSVPGSGGRRGGAAQPAAGEEKGEVDLHGARSTGWTLAPIGRPEMAFAWKGAMQTLRLVDKSVAAARRRSS